MATTTFCDIKMTEDLENYRYENQSYTWEEGQIISLPYHTAAKLVNKFDVAKWDREPYEVKQVDYDNVLGAEGSVETCEVEKSDGEVCGREKPCKYHDEE
jgi:hypothetical protein